MYIVRRRHHSPATRTCTLPRVVLHATTSICAHNSAAPRPQSTGMGLVVGSAGGNNHLLFVAPAASDNRVIFALVRCELDQRLF